MSSYYLVLIPVVLLVSIGQLMSLSSSSVYAQAISGTPYYFAVRQMVFLAVGIPVAWWLSRRSVGFLSGIAWPAMVLSVVLLLTLFTPLGIENKGNRAWISLGGLGTLQPAEFAKLASVVWAAAVLHNKQKVLDQPKQLLPPLLIGFGVPILLILAGGDLGTALVLVAIFASVLWLVGTPMVIMGGLGTALGGVVAVLVLASQNRMTRIMNFLAGTSHNDPTVSQQPLSAVYALATGGWFGVGLGGSRQKWGGLADAAQNDYVFAVLGEELGLFGTLSVIAAFAVLCYGGIRIAQRADTLFVRVVAGGITCWIMFQTLMNIGVALNALPVVGVPLPFISVGGSALLSNLLAAGVLLACARHEPAARKWIEAAASKKRRVTRVVPK
ncbi:peptidoglycan glycosyltransferase FtsW [Aestuariimicrobium kwangyangense]